MFKRSIAAAAVALSLTGATFAQTAGATAVAATHHPAVVHTTTTTNTQLTTAQIDQALARLRNGWTVMFTKVLVQDHQRWSVNAEGARVYAPKVPMAELQKMAAAMNHALGNATPDFNATSYLYCVLSGSLPGPVYAMLSQLPAIATIASDIVHGNFSGAYNALVLDFRSWLYSKGISYVVKQELLAVIDEEPAGLIAVMAGNAIACLF